MTDNELDRSEITINGKRLDVGHVMTIRVALTSYLMDMQEDDALGDDDHGKQMAQAYKERISEIFKLMGGGKS